MIRPIDTQILYPQSPKLSNSQQTDNQKPIVQQDQFAQLVQKEVKQKKDIIIPSKNNDKLNNNVRKDQEQSRQSKQQGKKYKSSLMNRTDKQNDENFRTGRLDIRI